jgi:pyridoxal phosphate enzyme (YggS family)
MYRERLAETLPRLLESVAEAARGARRDPSTVRVVAVTKGHPVEAPIAALEAGLVDLGENRVEELEQKAAQLVGHGARWHLIGHLQSRKVARALAVADLIHSLDSLRLAEKVSRAAIERGPTPVSALLQVNTSGEESKGGFSFDEGTDPLIQAASLPGLAVQGLMTMAPLTSEEAVLRTTFERLRTLLHQLRAHRPDVGGELSMGMTNDFRIAIEEGSTLIRIGTALFGERET